MDLYTKTAYEQSKTLTKAYSTSFSSATSLFPISIRHHVYAIYGLVRIADEIVDSYKGNETVALLRDLETETYAAISRGYSVNPLVHAFAMTSRQYGITKEIIEPFFASMAVDSKSKATFNLHEYEQYIYGSAEVVGLMCLRIFVANDQSKYDKLIYGAKKLGSAYQKVNFLRDFASDYTDLGRIYFPNVNAYPLTEADKSIIIADIQKDFTEAKSYITALPKHVIPAVQLSYEYYSALLTKLQSASADTISKSRIRVTNSQKSALFVKIAAVRAKQKIHSS